MSPPSPLGSRGAGNTEARSDLLLLSGPASCTKSACMPDSAPCRAAAGSGAGLNGSGLDTKQEPLPARQRRGTQEHGGAASYFAVRLAGCVHDERLLLVRRRLAWVVLMSRSAAAVTLRLASVAAGTALPRVVGGKLWAQRSRQQHLLRAGEVDQAAGRATNCENRAATRRVRQTSVKRSDSTGLVDVVHQSIAGSNSLLDAGGGGERPRAVTHARHALRREAHCAGPSVEHV